MNSILGYKHDPLTAFAIYNISQNRILLENLVSENISTVFCIITVFIPLSGYVSEGLRFPRESLGVIKNKNVRYLYKTTY